jgi:pyruvate formate lyase activating enzyme
VSSVAADPIEKKPLFHFFPGTMVLSLGTLGCNFACRGCQNWQVSALPDA